MNYNKTPLRDVSDFITDLMDQYRRGDPSFIRMARKAENIPDDAWLDCDCALFRYMLNKIEREMFLRSVSECRE